MSIQDITNWFGANPTFLLTYFIALAVLALIGLLIFNNDNFKSPITYAYSILVYAVSIPGLLAFMLLIYRIFFLKGNLLEVDFMTHFAPVLFMVGTLVVVNRTVNMDRIPGFNKLPAMFLIIVITMMVTYFLQKMFFGVFFIGRFKELLILFLALLFVIMLAWNRIKSR